MTAYILAWRMRVGLDGTRLSYRRSLRFARAGLAGVAALEGSC